MIRRLARDESGVAMGLAVIMIVLIGVMGAGLLVFVRNDLEAVVEVNQGQKALEAADAGIQAARRQLLSDATANATTNIYDSDTTNGDSPWSSVSGGRNLPFSGNAVNVKIQYLLPSDTPSELTDSNHAPELVPSGQTDYPEPVDYFKIIAEATAGDARRKVEAIYKTEDIGVPKGYYTPGNITVSGSSVCIDRVSLFSLKNIEFQGNGGCPAGGHMTGDDIAYGNWYKPPFNTTARTDATYGTKAGAGAVENITYTVAATSRLGTRDFHGSTINPTNPKFIQKNPPEGSQGANEISFPFDYALPDIDFLRDEAILQGNYREISTNNGYVEDNDWPVPPPGTDPDRTVVFYKFTGGGSNNLYWDVDGAPGTEDCDDPPKEGTLVVENGNFNTQPNKIPFKGVVVVRGGALADGSSDDTGNTCLKGFVNADGTINIKGSVSPMSTPDIAKRPGWYGVELWSWRELYQ